MGGDRPKQYHKLLGRPIICHTLDRFLEVKPLDELVVVVPPDYLSSFKAQIIKPYGYPDKWQVVAGGQIRQESVRNGLAAISDDCEVVLVHDGVRPFIRPELIIKSMERAAAGAAVIIAAPIKETIKKVAAGGAIEETVDRQHLWGAQTPQAFRLPLLKQAMEKAYQEGFVATDEAGLVERLGVKVEVIEGDAHNIKITTPDDMMVAESIARFWPGN